MHGQKMHLEMIRLVIVLAISRVLGENSELQEFWDEDGVNETWHQVMDDLATRVAS